MKLGTTKLSYLIHYGISPYFRELLEEKIRKATTVVVFFDESLNKDVQKRQMDVLIRFYDETNHEVTTHYLTSAFLSTASAIDILNAFKASLNSVPIPLSKILQVSMDGPNINWSFMEKLTSEMAIDTDNGPAILNMGSCGLHVIHGAFQTGHSTAKWNVNQVLNCAYYAFADSLARRASFTCITGSQTFPLKFCQTRWVGNSRVASRFLEQLT